MCWWTGLNWRKQLVAFSRSQVARRSPEHTVAREITGASTEDMQPRRDSMFMCRVVTDTRRGAPTDDKANEEGGWAGGWDDDASAIFTNFFLSVWYCWVIAECFSPHDFRFFFRQRLEIDIFFGKEKEGSSFWKQQGSDENYKWHMKWF